MTNNEAFALIGKRAEELAKVPSVRNKAMEIYREKGKDEATDFLIVVAIATLFGNETEE